MSVALGYDRSGNGNNWTVNNLASTDQMVDTPTNNFCTMNPLDMSGTSSVFKNGNLHAVNSTNQYAQTFSTFVMDSGKWYAEGCLVDVISGSPQTHMGIKTGTGANAAADRWLGEADPGTYDGVTNLWTKAQGTVVAAAIDVDAGKAWFHDGTSWLSGDPSAGTSPSLSSLASPIRMAMDSANSEGLMWNFGQDSSFAGTKTAQGNQDGNGIGDFYYAPPTGFLALCTKNLPDPTVIPSEHFNTVTYTGDGGTNRGIIGIGFAPDFVWTKMRSGAWGHGQWDTVRGATKRLTSAEQDAEVTWTDAVKSFDSDGFTTGSNEDTNKSSSTFVAWNWKAGGAPTTDNVASAGATPTAGSVKIDGSNLGSALSGSLAATRLSANTDAGFSVLTYSGNSTNSTVAHGLSKAPEMVIVKIRNLQGTWAVYTKPLTAAKLLMLDRPIVPSSSGAAFWNSTEPTASVFSLGTDGDSNATGYNYVAYCFHSVDGHSKVGSYTGNGSADGTFVYTGFRPAYVMFKSSSHAYTWGVSDSVRDTYNVVMGQLDPAYSVAEATDSRETDFLSNGFKIRQGNGERNSNGATYIYIAFAEMPFKHSNAR